MFYADSFSPFRRAKLQPIPFDNVVLSGVALLLLRRCPVAIVFTVVAIVVFSFKTKARRTWPHISVKALELHPPLTHLYTASTITGVSLAAWRKASMFHAPPDTILGGAAHFVCLTHCNFDVDSWIACTLLARSNANSCFNCASWVRSWSFWRWQF